ncbi:MAG: MBL fold metallo-hydrolase, partial [Polyangiaceae bacterium]
ASHVVATAPNGAPIAEIELRQSNVYVIEGARPILIDTGTLGDMPDLVSALRDLDLRPADLRLAIVTHAHHDHAGLARDLRTDYGVKIMLGAGDEAQAARGEDDTLRPQNVTAFFLKPFLVEEFPEFEADYLVRTPIDLAPWGVSGVAIQMPGHTAGSIVVVLSNHVAFVGDEMLGGYFGGAIFPHHPGEHYYQADPEANRRNIRRLLAMGVETFLLGHGGPVSRADVAAAFGSTR